MNSDTYVIIPFYNEKGMLGKVVREVLEQFEHVVCVDDGSTDGSADELRGSGAVLLQFPFNLGKGAALRTAFEYCLAQDDAEYFLTFDADGQHQVGDALSLYKAIKTDKWDIVLGSRFLDDSTKIPAAKRVLLQTAARFTNSTSGITLTDAHNGLRIMNRKAAAGMQLTQSGFSYASEIIDRIRENNLRYAEVPVTVLYTDYSRSKGQPMLNSVNILFDLLVNNSRKNR